MSTSMHLKLHVPEDSVMVQHNLMGKIVLQSHLESWKLVDIKVQLAGYEENKDKKKTIFKTNLDLYDDLSNHLSLDDEHDYIGSKDNYKLDFMFFLANDMLPSFEDNLVDWKLYYMLKCKLEIKHNSKVYTFKQRTPIAIYPRQQLMKKAVKEYSLFVNPNRKKPIYLIGQVEEVCLSGSLLTVNYQLKNHNNQSIKSTQLSLIKSIKISNHLDQQRTIHHKLFIAPIKEVKRDAQLDISHYLLLLDIPYNQNTIDNNKFKIHYKLELKVVLVNNIKLIQMMPLKIINSLCLVNKVTEGDLQQENVLVQSLLTKNGHYSVYERDIDTPTTNLSFIDYFVNAKKFAINQIDKPRVKNTIKQPSNLKSKSLEIDDTEIQSIFKHKKTTSDMPWRNKAYSTHRRTQSLDTYTKQYDNLLNQLPLPPEKSEYLELTKKLNKISNESIHFVHKKGTSLSKKSHQRSQTLVDDYYYQNEIGQLPMINEQWTHTKTLSYDSHPKRLFKEYLDTLPPPPIDEIDEPNRGDSLDSNDTMVDMPEDEELNGDVLVTINPNFTIVKYKRLSKENLINNL